MKRLALVVVSACASARPPPLPRCVELSDQCAVLFARGELERAQDTCNVGLEYCPAFPSLWVNRGNIARQRGDRSGAKEAYIKALRLDQHSAIAFNNLGMVYLDDAMYREAGDNFRAALKIDPGYLEARFNLALAQLGLGDRQAGAAALRELTVVEPALARPWALLGQLALEDGDVPRAIELLTTATTLTPAVARPWMALGAAYLEAGRPCEAKEAFTMCLDAQPPEPTCQQPAAVAAERCALFDRALER